MPPGASSGARVGVLKMDAPEGANRPGHIRSGITIQRVAISLCWSPIPPNASSLEGQSLTSLNLSRFVLAMVKALGGARVRNLDWQNKRHPLTAWRGILKAALGAA